MSTAPESGHTDEGMLPGGAWTQLRESARGWLSIQLGVLGFIGLCGVLTSAGPDLPWTLQLIAGIVALVAFACACLSVLVVASVAWPAGRATRTADDAAKGESRLRTGLIMTIVALSLVVLATTAGWWPGSGGGGGEAEGAGGGLVRADVAGRSFCGDLLTGEEGLLTLEVDGRSIALPLSQVTSIELVDSC